jgi:hypothetical protein
MDEVHSLIGCEAFCLSADGGCMLKGSATHKPGFILRQLRDLQFILIEVERGVELRLAREQVFQT